MKKEVEFLSSEGDQEKIMYFSISIAIGFWP